MRVCRVRYAMGVCLCAAVRFGSSPLVVPRLPGVHAPHTCLRAHGCITHRLYPMRVAGHLTIRDCSSTQIPDDGLSATTLSVAQLASHSHNLNGGAFIGNGRGGDYAGQVQWASSGFRAFNTTANTGSNWSHSHGISNPAHSHTAPSTSIKLMPPAKALHYIMRIA